MAGVRGEKKEAASPVVTEVDLSCEKIIRNCLIQSYPEDTILGEELPQKTGNNPWSWVIDPIDGTIAFQTGKPMFTTLLALVFDKEPVAGWIYQPILEKFWLGRRGFDLLSSETISDFKSPSQLEESVLSTTTPAMFSDPPFREFFETLTERAWLTSFGGDAYQYGLLAQGRIDLVVENQMAWHDFAALVPIVESAGAMITDFEGKPLGKESGGQVLATRNPKIHAEVIEVYNFFLENEKSRL